MKGIFGWIKRKNLKSDGQSAPKHEVEHVVEPLNQTENGPHPTSDELEVKIEGIEPSVSKEGDSAPAVLDDKNHPKKEVHVSPIIDEEVQLIIEQLNNEKQSSGEVKDAQYQSQDGVQQADLDSVSLNAEKIEHDKVATGSETVENNEDTLLKKLRAGFKTSKQDKTNQSDKKVSLKTLLGLESSHRGSVPVKIFIGYLPDVLERDAMEYAMGVAERNCEQSSITYFDVFKYDGGFVYEIHEGGRGKAYIPEILKFFEDAGDFDNLNPIKVYIHTAIRTVEVEKLRKGLVAVWLPESKRIETTPGLEPKQDLIPATNQRTGFLVISAMFFIVSFLSMIVAAITQYQPYDPAPEFKYQELDYSKSVSGQWGRINDAVLMGKIVKAVKFEGGVWRALEVEEAAPEAAASAPDNKASAAHKE